MPVKEVARAGECSELSIPENKDYGAAESACIVEKRAFQRENREISISKLWQLQSKTKQHNE